MPKRKQPPQPVMTQEQALREVEKLSLEEQTRLLELAGKKLGVSAFYTRLEDVVEFGFELETMSPLQRAICRIVQGISLGELAAHPHVAPSLGLAPEEMLEWEEGRIKRLHLAQPFEVLLIAGIRTFKSMLIAAAAIWAAQTVDVSICSAGDIPRYSIVSVSKDNAKICLAHLLGCLQKKTLAPLRISDAEMKAIPQWKDIIKEATEDVVGSVFLRHPSGRPIEVRVVAGKRAGSSVVSRWCAGLALDEAPRMVGADEGVVNYSDMRGAVLGRLLPGAQVFSVGSPWQPRGPVYDAVVEWFGRPNQDRVVIRAKGFHMNPIWWNEFRCAELRRRDPVQYQMDVEAEFADIGEALIAEVLISAAKRAEPDYIPYNQLHQYSAAMDPATRSNAWTLVIADRHRTEDGRDMKRIVYNRQWIGNPLAPLRPRDVLKDIKEDLSRYGLTYVSTDQWAAEALQDIASGLGLQLVLEEWNAQENVDAYLSFRAGMEERCVELPPDPQVAKDIRLIRKEPGRPPRPPSIVLATTADGRHCDYAPAIVRALKDWLDAPRQTPIDPTSEEGLKQQLDEWREKAYAQVKAKQAFEAEKARNWLQVDPFADPEAVHSVGKPKPKPRRNVPWLQ